MKKKPLTPLVKDGGFIASAEYTPLVYPGGKTTMNATPADEISADKENGESETKTDGNR